MGADRVTKNILVWQTDKRSVAETVKAADVIEASQRDVAAAASEASKSIGGKADAGAAIGKGDTLVSSLSTLSGSFGFAGSEALGAAGDILGTADALIGFKETFMAVQAGSQAAAAGTTAAAGGFAAIGAALAPVLVAVVAIGGPLLAIKSVFDAAGKAAERAREAIRRQVETMRLQAQVAEEARGMTVEEIEARKQALDRQIADLNADIAALDAQRDATNETRDAWDHLTGAIITTAKEGSIQELDEQIRELGNEARQLAEERMALNNAFARGREDTNELISSLERQAFEQQRLAEIVEGTTLPQLQEQIAANEQAQQSTQTLISNLESRRAAEQAQIAGLERGTEEYLRSEAAIVTYNEAIREQQDELAQLQLTAEDLAAALPLINEYSTTTIDAVQKSIENERRRGELLRNMSLEQLQQAQNDAEIEIDLLEKQHAALMRLAEGLEVIPAGLSSAIGDAASQLEDAQKELQFLSSASTLAAVKTNELARAHKEAADNDARIVEQAGDAFKRYNDQLEQDAKRGQQHRLKIETDLQKQLTKIDADAAKERDKLLSELATVDVDANKARNKAIEDFNKESIKLARERNKEQLRAERDHNRSLQDAMLSRNVDAFVAEQQKFADEQAARDDGTRDRQDALQQELQEIEEARQQRRAELQQQIADQQQAAEAQREQAKADAEQARRDLARNLDAQQQEREQAFREQLAQLNSNLSAESAAKQQAQQQQLSQLQAFLGNAGNAFNSSIASLNKTLSASLSSARATMQRGFSAPSMMAPGMSQMRSSAFGGGFQSKITIAPSAQFNFPTSNIGQMQRGTNQALIQLSRNTQAQMRQIKSRVR